MIVQTVEKSLPLIVRRDGEIVVNFDIGATQAFHFVDSKRPIYTYIPGFNVQKVPTAIRRPLSNLGKSLHSLRKGDGVPRLQQAAINEFRVCDFALEQGSGERSGM